MTKPLFLRTCRPYLEEGEKSAVCRVIDSGYLGSGPEAAAFEQELQDYFGNNRTVLCVGSGTAALHLALVAAGIGHGDEVLVPSLTYVASFQAVAVTGARPVACDVRLEDGLIDLDDARRRLTNRTRALMPVHFAGYAGDIDAVHAFGVDHGLRVIEDAAHAFGSRHGEKLLGSFGDVACFSFDPIKNITSGQGGAVVTNDPEVIVAVRRTRDLGIEPVPSTADNSDFSVTGLGWRYPMFDLEAAIGRTQLARFETELKPFRQALANHYRASLSGIPGIQLLRSTAAVVPHIMPIRVTGGARDRVRSALADSGYETRIHYKPNHLLQAFNDGNPRPACEELHRQILSLPLHGGVTFQAIDSITAIVSLQAARR